ncbi:DNA translocase FtsK [Paenibacillus alvei]|nr:DNA translocase FtsK [Paenibacillus alvei]
MNLPWVIFCNVWMTIFFLTEYSLLAGVLFGSVSSIYVIYRYFSDKKEREAERQKMIADATTYEEDYEDNEEVEYEDDGEEESADGDEEDELLEDAAIIVAEVGYASTALLQSKLNIGAQRARLIQEQLECAQIVGPPSASDRRQALLTPDGVAARIKEVYSNEEDLTEEEQAEADRNIEALLQELHELTGLDAMHQNIQRLVRLIQRLNNRYDLGQDIYYPRIHMIFATEPGTWEMRAADLISSLFHELFYLSKRTVTEVNYKQLIDPYRRRRSQSTLDIVEQARGGVLVIQDAYKLLEDDRTGQGREVLDTLFCCLENETEEDDEILVILTGAPEKMHRFMEEHIEIGLYFTSVYALNIEAPSASRTTSPLVEKRNESTSLSDTEQSCNHTAEMHSNMSSSDMSNADKSQQIDKFQQPDESLQRRTLSANPNYSKAQSDQTGESRFNLQSNLNEFLSSGVLGEYAESLRQLVHRLSQYQEGRAKGLYVDMPPMCLAVMGGIEPARVQVIELLSQAYKGCGILSWGQIVPVSIDNMEEQDPSSISGNVMSNLQHAKNGMLVLRVPAQDRNRTHADKVRALTESLVKATDRYSSETVIIIEGDADDVTVFLKNSSVLRMRFTEIIQLPNLSEISS